MITDGWDAYRAISGKGYQQRRINQKAAAPLGMTDSLLRGVHRVASLCKRWLLGTTRARLTRAPARLSTTSSSSGSTAADRPAGHGVLPGPAASRRPTSQSGTWICSPAKSRGKRLRIPAASRTICIGSEYWRMNARQPGSALPAASVLGPNRPERAAASAELRPRCASTSTARRTRSTLSVCHASPLAWDSNSSPGASVSLGCTGHSFLGELRSRLPGHRNPDDAPWRSLR